MNELDIFNPQVSTVAKGLEGKVILVYGGNNLGKTKQATHMKKPFYLPFEAGLNAIPGVPYCPITKWSDFIKINKQLTDPATVEKAREMYSTIIFDEIEAAANYCQEFICQKYKAPSIGEGNGGYGRGQCVPRSCAEPGASRAAGHRPEPRHLLPGPRSLQHLL